MSDLSEADVNRIADTLVQRVREQKHDFWIDPEKHYQDHARMQGFAEDDIRDLHNLIKAFKMARGLFWKAFIGLAIIGALGAALVGLGFRK